MSGDARQRGLIPLGGRSGRTAAEIQPEKRWSGERQPAKIRPVELTKRAPRAEITGRDVLQVNLNWSVTAEADLDLGCMVLTRDGSGTAVQPLGDNLGALASWPYVELDQDDRTGEASDGETLRVNLAHRREFTRLLIYVYVYEGAVDFRSLGGAVTVSGADGTWRILLDDSPAGATACAIALLEPSGHTLELRRESRWFTPEPYASNQQLIDQAYGFGFSWIPGHKPPL
ncbi:tellurium resistance protein [Streptomyces lichenis]|uniref:Tellurium resistance protein n=1 Tax=Streptomyces lichenis TaxID=2306967 RepID=A0ABT0I3Y1_9ACTN|nr:tellurium resistance protein [Streptomyces lichenis]MCK8676023.1 tellurium resistance protein [Streptomyces lichenis]